MAAGQPVRAQVRAYRFATRQVQWAVMHGDPLLITDPVARTRRWTLVGFALTVVALAGFAVYGLIKPVPQWQSATLILESDTSELLVNRDGTLYPALNMTSALLVIGNGSQSNAGARPAAQVMTATDLRDAPRGPQLGIPGAPDSLPNPADLSAPRWSLCEQTITDPSQAQPLQHATLTSTAVFGTALTGLDADAAALVHQQGLPANQGNYLITDGRRSVVDLADPAVTGALHLDPTSARPVSATLLQAIPQAADLTRVSIDKLDQAPAGNTVSGLKVGSVFATEMTSGQVYFVVLADGVQMVPPVVADLIRLQHTPVLTIPQVKPDLIPGLRITAHPLAVDAYPATPPTLSSADQDPVMCSNWDGADPSRPIRTVSMGAAIRSTSGHTPTALARNAGVASQADQLLMAGSGAAVRGVTGSQNGTQGTISLVSDEGVRFPVPSTDVLAALALPTTTAAAPQEILQALPAGPELDAADAARLWDAVPAAASTTSGPARTLPPPTSSAPATKPGG